MSTTHCQYCGTDPCRGVTNMCDLATYLAGNPTAVPATSTPHTLTGTKFTGNTWVTHTVVFDGKQWVYGNEGAILPVTEPVPETKRACECGVWATGGLHSDWCPCAGGDCAQAEDA